MTWLYNAGAALQTQIGSERLTLGEELQSNAYVTPLLALRAPATLSCCAE